jgi:GrpB-like predicted nucleotidyltransferase (UPF0157 family)
MMSAGDDAPIWRSATVPCQRAASPARNEDLAGVQMPTPEQITTFAEDAPGKNPWVRGGPTRDTVVVVAADPSWAASFAQVATDLRAALGSVALAIEHVGSTSVPGLAAKPVLDVDLTVADPTREDRYVPALAVLGYWHELREPSWYEHRGLRLDRPRVNLHVWGPDSPELVRHRLFRDWLRTHPEDRLRYEDAKRAAAPGADAVATYNARKQPVLREKYARLFAAAGLS